MSQSVALVHKAFKQHQYKWVITVLEQPSVSDGKDLDMRHLTVTSVSCQTSLWYVSGFGVPATKLVNIIISSFLNWKHRIRWVWKYVTLSGEGIYWYYQDCMKCHLQIFDPKILHTHVFACQHSSYGHYKIISIDHFTAYTRWSNNNPDFNLTTTNDVKWPAWLHIAVTNTSHVPYPPTLRVRAHSDVVFWRSF